MKNLILIRHATAVVADAAGRTDFYRDLAPDGIAEAKKIAEHLKTILPTPDSVLSSSAPRAVQTAQIFKPHFFSTLKITEERELYHLGYADILDTIEEIIDDAHTTLFFVRAQSGDNTFSRCAFARHKFGDETGERHLVAI